MTVHLDTNYLIGALQARPREAALMHAAVAGTVRVGVCAIVWCEFLCGPLSGGMLPDLSQIVGPPVPFTVADAALAASLFNFGGRRRNSLADCQIAAVAIRCGAALATADRTGFTRFAAAGLQLAS